jgi:hypothetical protein
MRGLAGNLRRQHAHIKVFAMMILPCGHHTATIIPCSNGNGTNLGVSEEKGKKRQLNSRSEEKKTKKRIFGPVTGVQIFTGEKEDFADGGNTRCSGKPLVTST